MSNEAKNNIGLSKVSLSDLPAAHRIISSLSFRKRLILIRTDKKRQIGIVKSSIFGNSSKTYERYDIKETLSDVNRSMCLRLCPNHKIELKRIINNKKLEENSLIAYVVNLDIFSIISIFC